MIATISLPGGKNFEWKHVKDDVEARVWREQWLRIHGETQETLQAVWSGVLLTDRQAKKARYSSGEKIYVREGILLSSGP